MVEHLRSFRPYRRVDARNLLRSCVLLRLFLFRIGLE